MKKTNTSLFGCFDEDSFFPQGEDRPIEDMDVTSGFFGTGDEYRPLRKDLHEVAEEIKDTVEKVKAVQDHIELDLMPHIEEQVEESEQNVRDTAHIKNQVDAIKVQMDADAAQLKKEIEDAKSEIGGNADQIKGELGEIKKEIEVRANELKGDMQHIHQGMVDASNVIKGEMGEIRQGMHNDAAFIKTEMEQIKSGMNADVAQAKIDLEAIKQSAITETTKVKDSAVEATEAVKQSAITETNRIKGETQDIKTQAVEQTNAIKESAVQETTAIKNAAVAETNAIKAAVTDLQEGVALMVEEVRIIEDHVLEDRTATENARDIAIDAKEVTMKTKDQAIVEMNSIKKEVNDLKYQTGEFAEQVALNTTKAQNSATDAKNYADKSKEIYDAFAKGAVYKGTWNPEIMQMYPPKPETSAYWDVYLREGVLKYPLFGITWFSGDRLIYSKPDDRFFHVSRVTGVQSVNGKFGAVTLKAQDVQALSIEGGMVMGDINIFRRGQQSHTGLTVLADNPAVILTDLDAPSGSANTIIGAEGDQRDSLYVITPNDNDQRRKIFHEGNKPTWEDVGGDNYFEKVESQKGSAVKLTVSHPSMQLGDGMNPGFYPPAHKKGSIGAKGFAFNHIWGDTIHGSEVQDSGQRVYSPANKPSLSELGAMSSNGGVMNGELIIDNPTAIHPFGLQLIAPIPTIKFDISSGSGNQQGALNFEEDGMYLTTPSSSGKSKVYTEANPPTWAAIKGRDYLFESDRGHYQIGKDKWLQMSTDSAGIVPAHDNVEGGASYLGTRDWKFKEVHAHLHYGHSFIADDGLLGRYVNTATLNLEAPNKQHRAMRIINGGSAKGTVLEMASPDGKGIAFTAQAGGTEGTRFSATGDIYAKGSKVITESTLPSHEALDTYNRGTIDSKLGTKLDKTAKAADSAKLNGYSDYYSPRNLPTTATLGAVAKTGDTMSGFLRNTNGMGVDLDKYFYFNSANAGIGWGVTEEKSSGALRFKTREGTGSWVNRAHFTPDGQLYIAGANKVYHQGFRPTAAEVGALTKAQADGYYLGKTAKAADSAKLNGYDDYYSPRRKPSPADIGTLTTSQIDSKLSPKLNKSGDTMSGALTISTANADPKLIIHRTNLNGNISIGFKPQSGATVNFGLRADGALGYGTNADLSQGAKIYSTVHKPTAGEIGALTQSVADGRYLGKTAKAVSAGTADSASAATYATTYLRGNYVSGGKEKPNYFGGGKLRCQMIHSTDGGGINGWTDALWISGYSGSDVKLSNALLFSKTGSPRIGFRQQNFDSTTWGTFYEIYHTGKKPTASEVGALPVGGKAADASLLNGRSDYYSPANKPSAEAIGALPSNWFIADGPYPRFGKNNWLRANAGEGGFLPYAHGYSYLGTSGWRFSQAWVNDYRGGSMTLDGTIKSNGVSYASDFHTNRKSYAAFVCNGDRGKHFLMEYDSGSGNMNFIHRNDSGGNIKVWTMKNNGNLKLAGGMEGMNTGSSWISQKTSDYVPVILDGVTQDAYAAGMRFKSTQRTATVGCLGNTAVGFYGYNNSETVNQTNQQAYLNLIDGKWYVNGTYSRRTVQSVGERIGFYHEYTGKDGYIEMHKPGAKAYAIGINSNNSYGFNETNGGGTWTKTRMEFQTNGNMYVYGAGYATGGWAKGSDIRFKDVVSTYSLEDEANTALERVAMIGTSKYTLKADDTKHVHFGFIAQNVAEVIPEAVKTYTIHDESYVAKEGDTSADCPTVERMFLDTDAITALHNEAIKELTVENQELKDRVAALEKLVAQLINKE